MTTAAGWQQLIPAADLFRGAGRYPIDAYSEFMPPPQLGWKPYGGEPPDDQLFKPEDPWGWYVSEYEEANELGPGLEQVAHCLVGKVRHMIHGDPTAGVSRPMLTDNVYWSPELTERRGSLAHDRCVLLMPLALSRTLDDKGRLRWTFFGCSEQGPARGLRKSFYASPGTPVPADDGPRFISRLLQAVYREQADPHQAGFRI